MFLDDDTQRAQRAARPSIAFSAERPLAMTWRVWWMFLATETALSISPGPAVLFVVSQSLRLGFVCGLWAALGIVSANVVWFALSAVGVGAALLAAGDWFLALKWLGAAYLVYLALKPFIARTGDEVALPVAERPRSSALAVWSRGVLLQLTNPKALIFFAALLPQFVQPDGDVGRQILILGATSVS
jgi:threonine/homoserine/homoserine lactone efflux protein